MIIRRLIQTEEGSDEPDRTDEGIVGRRIASVSELTREISLLLEGEFENISVQGEISGWNRASSGHTYFTLKDEGATLGGVLWRSRTLEHPIQNGMKVVARGRITVYAARGQYQLDCTSIAPLGVGDLQLAFERLKGQLLAEGLFELERKRPLPQYPRKIGVVTSRTGAAIRDIVTTLRRRMPLLHLVLRPALVQGAGAAEDIARAIDELNEIPDLDLMIVGRGGGSIEDLWAFNEESVARAIFRSRVPVVSAVGHEVDYTIADFVADLRAATPTAAAEIVVRDRAELIPALREIESTLTDLLVDRIERGRQQLSYLLRSRGLARPLDLVRSHQQRIDDLTHRASLGLRAAVVRERERLNLLESTLHALNPTNVLARGYAIVERDGQAVSRARELEEGDQILLRMYDGVRRGRIEGEEGDEGERARD